MSEEPIHILLVEDEPAHAELVRRAFEAHNDRARLTVAGSLGEARACLAQSKPLHLIIADWRLPDGEGVELLTSDRPTLPVVIMTSHGNERAAVEALKAGALDYLVKSETTLLDMPHTAERVLREWNTRAERARMQKALREGEQRFQSAFDNAPIGMAIVGLDDRILQVNQALCDILGYEPDQLLATTVAAITHPDDRQIEATQKTKLRDKSLQIFEMEKRYLHADGRIVWGQLRVSIVKDDAGNPLYFLGQMEDITQRKQAELALRQYAGRLAILHEIDQSIIAAKSIEDIADAALSRMPRFAPIRRVKAMLFDFATEEAVIVAHYCDGVRQPTGERQPLAVLGPVDTLLPGEVFVINDLSELLDPSPNQLRQIDDGARSSIDAPLIVLGRQIGLLSVDSVRWNAFQGELVDVVSEVADVLAVALQNAHLLERAQQQTRELEQRVIERTRELAAANERLTELDRLKSKFVSDVSHELRTPIANLKLHVELLEHGRPEKHAHYLTVVKQQARRLAQLVDDILNLAGLEMGHERVVLGPVDLNFVVEQIVAAYQPRAESAGLTLLFEPQPGLPPVCGEVNQLSQVVTNLVINAMNYTPQGLVRVSTLRRDAEACLQIEDSGMGIDPADLPNIFDRFYRGRGSQRSETPGTGLGLAIVKEIVDLHEGRIEVETRLKQGTTFRVWLPLYRGNGAA